MLVLPGRGKIVFARLYWASLCRLLGLRVRVIGRPARPDGRPVVFASNHSSWLDILALGGVLEACFIAKEEVGRWPVIRTVARLGRTVFVSRRPADTGRERNAMRDRLDAGDNLILFPEGTSSDGSRVLPFRSVFFSVAEAQPGRSCPLIQPVSIVYDQLGGLPIGRASRPVFAWYGDMDLASHFWRLAQHRGLRATVLLHAPVDPGRLCVPQGAGPGGVADGGRGGGDASAEPAGAARPAPSGRRCAAGPARFCLTRLRPDLPHSAWLGSARPREAFERCRA